GDLLRALSGHEQAGDLALPGRQTARAFLDDTPLLAGAALLSIELERLPDPGEERGRAHGFLDEIERTGAKTLHRRGNRAVRGQDDDRRMERSRAKVVEDVHAALTAQEQVEHHAAGALRIEGRKELAAGRIRLGADALGREKREH